MLTPIGPNLRLEEMIAGSESNKAARELASKGKKNGQLWKAAQDFEAFFMNLLLKEMRKTTQPSLFGDSQAEKTFSELLDQEYANNLSKRSGLGIADLVFKQLGGDQELLAKSKAAPRKPMVVPVETQAPQMEIVG